MARSSPKVHIEPSVLAWARETIGMTAEKVAEEMHVSLDLVHRWESGREAPTLNELRRLSEHYRRPLAAFFLSEPPAEPPLPRDFRTLPGAEVKPLSRGIRLAMRRARRLQGIAGELMGESYTQVPFTLAGASLSDDPEALAGRFRGELGVSLDQQSGWEDENEALEQWTAAVEARGVLVFQMTWPLEEARAFSVRGGGSPAIVLNTKDAVNGRIFSLFHELGHLLLGQEGICDLGAAEVEGLGMAASAPVDAGGAERFCNCFAGAVLVPRDALVGHRLVEGAARGGTWAERDLGVLGRHFGVSKEVVLRRLALLGRATRSFYQAKRDEWLAHEAVQRKKGGGRRDVPRECLRNNGRPFVSLVVESYRGARITSSDVSDYLGIRLKHLPQVERLLEARA